MPACHKPNRQPFAIFALCALSLAGCSLVPAGNGDSGQTVRSGQTGHSAISPQARQCLSDLGATQADFSPVPDKYYGAGCSTLNSVSLAAVQSDTSTLSLTNLGPVSCPLATAFSAWARYGVDRAARQIMGSPLARIETFGSYSCRNVAGTGRRSAHSTANAIDVSAFVLQDGRRISVKNAWGQGSRTEQEFLQIIHTSACKRFGTVLGPAYNAAHHDHFHLERSGGGFCR